MLACPDRQALSAFAVGIGPVVELDDIAAHLETCQSCQETLEALELPVDAVLAAVQLGGAESPFVAEPECQAAMAAIAEFCPTSDSPILNVAPLEMIREYELLEKIGAGGMGTVYRARHTHLNRIVALKVLPADRLSDPQAVARFRQEMRAVGQLDHPHIVRAFDAGQHGQTHYLVLEYVDGTNLATLSRRCGGLAIADACELIRQAAVGLDYAHSRQLVHRDLKPSNLLLTRDGQVKILDFGLALLRGDQVPLSELTSTGQVMGTLDYMAPEQIQDTHGVDIRADLYSLGCTLFKLLAGTTPFVGPEYKTVYQKMQGHTLAAPPSITDLRPDVPEALAALIGRLLAKDPAERPATPAELAAAIAPFAVGADLARMLARASTADDTTQIVVAKSSESVAVSSHQVETGVALPLPMVPTAGAQAQEAPTLLPAPLVRRPRGRTARWLQASAAGLILLAAVITITTKQGTVTITQSDAVTDTVEVVLRSGGEDVAVLDKSNHWTVAVRNGDYDVALRGGNDQFQVKDGRLTVKRFGKTLVEIETKSAAVAAKTSDRLNSTPNADPGRRAVEWCLGIGGTARVRTASQESDIAVRNDIPETAFRVISLHLADCRKLSDRGLENVAGLDSLEHLDVHGTRVSDTALQVMSGLRGLRSLDLRRTAVTDSGMASIALLQGLESLNLGHTRISDAGLSVLSGLARLTDLSLDGTRVSNSGLIHLLKMRKLGGLNVANTQISDDGLRSLGHLKGLTILELSCTQITGAGLVHLLQLQSLKSLGLDGTKVDAKSVARLHELPNLTGLSLNGTPVDDDAVKELASLTQLEHLNLNDTLVSNAGLCALVPIRGLRFLYLEGTRVTLADNAAVKCLESFESLEAVRLNRCPVSPDSLARLRVALPQCKIDCPAPVK